MASLSHPLSNPLLLISPNSLLPPLQPPLLISHPQPQSSRLSSQISTFHSSLTMDKKVKSIHRRINRFILTSLRALPSTGNCYVRFMSFIADKLEYEGGDELQGYSLSNAQLISSRDEELRELIAACADREALLRSRSVAECPSDFAGELRVGESLFLIRSPTSYALAKRKPTLFSA